MKNYTDITVLVDRSGSMQRIKNAMEEGFDIFLSEHKINPNTKMSLIQFDGSNDQDVVYINVPVKAAERLILIPRGSTPLNDAICKTIDNTGKRLAALDEKDRPNKVLFVVITDGAENASRTYSSSDVRSRVEKQEGHYNWQFVYMGANQDAYAESQKYGFDWNKAIKWSTDGDSVRGAMRGLASNTVSYANGGVAASLNYTELQRSNAATVADRAVDSTPTTSSK